MRRLAHEFARAAAAAACIALWYIIFLMAAPGCAPDGVVQPGHGEPSEAVLEQKHHYHGILFSEQDEQGNWWGVRESGERFLMWRGK